MNSANAMIHKKRPRNYIYNDLMVNGLLMM